MGSSLHREKRSAGKVYSTVAVLEWANLRRVGFSGMRLPAIQGGFGRSSILLPPAGEVLGSQGADEAQVNGYRVLVFSSDGYIKAKALRWYMEEVAECQAKPD